MPGTVAVVLGQYACILCRRVCQDRAACCPVLLLTLPVSCPHPCCSCWRNCCRSACEVVLLNQHKGRVGRHWVNCASAWCQQQGYEAQHQRVSGAA